MSVHAALTIAFFIAFVALVLWVFRPGRKQDYQELGDIPFNGEVKDKSRRQEERHG